MAACRKAHETIKATLFHQLKTQPLRYQGSEQDCPGSTCKVRITATGRFGQLEMTADNKALDPGPVSHHPFPSSRISINSETLHAPGRGKVRSDRVRRIDKPSETLGITQNNA